MRSGPVGDRSPSSSAVIAFSAPNENCAGASGQLRGAEDLRLLRHARVLPSASVRRRRAASGRCAASRTGRCSCRRCSRDRRRTCRAPSTKNGRRSGKNVSKPLRLTTAGSASTWPKSGFTVAGQREARTQRVFQVGADRRLLIVRRDERVARLGRLRVHLPDDVRHQLEPLRRLIQLQVREIAEGRHEAVRALRDAAARCRSRSAGRSRGRRRSRTSALSDGWKRSCENGMRNSARQPSLSRETATSHTASQPLSSFASLNQ